MKKVKYKCQYNYMPHPSYNGWSRLTTEQEKTLKMVREYYENHKKI